MPKAWHVDRGNRGRLYPARRYLGERRLKAIGRTPAGRHAFIIFTWRAGHAGSALLRPISARYMHKSEVEAYEKANPDLQNK
jgi:uncharacterized DUF497 family protein